MTCPVCNGSGRSRRRFLLFFTRRARCANCLGTGEFPPPIGEQARYAPSWGRDEDTFDRGNSSTSAARDRDDSFEVGSGGRSGGGGGGASWGDESSAPVIVDPFAADSPSVSGVADSEASDTSSSEDSSSDGGGTTY
jgi:hypothetical protein